MLRAQVPRNAAPKCPDRIRRALKCPDRIPRTLKCPDRTPDERAPRRPCARAVHRRRHPIDDEMGGRPRLVHRPNAKTSPRFGDAAVVAILELRGGFLVENDVGEAMHLNDGGRTHAGYGTLQRPSDRLRLFLAARDQ